MWLRKGSKTRNHQTGCRGIQNGGGLINVTGTSWAEYTLGIEIEIMDHQHRAKEALDAVSRLTLSSVEDIIIIIIRVGIQSFERTDAVRCAKQRGNNSCVYNNFAVADRVSILGGRLVNSDKGPNRERER
jgi:hypothetical protein